MPDRSMIDAIRHNLLCTPCQNDSRCQDSRTPGTDPASCRHSVRAVVRHQAGGWIAAVSPMSNIS